MSISSSKPWLQWPYELPTCTEQRQTNEYQMINDETFHRQMQQEIRANTFAAFGKESGAAIILAGGTSIDFELYDSDVDKTEFRQEFFFRYLFGINEPDCFGILDLNTHESILFYPEITEASERWNGARRPMSYYTERYGVNETVEMKFAGDQIDSILQKRGINKLYTLFGTNSDSGNSTRTIVKFDGMDKYTIDNEKLYPTLSELRAHKTDKEIELLRLANLISSQAHVYVMRHIKPGMTEMQLEALYKAWCHFHGGCRHMAYTCICGSGAHGSILHYGHAGRPNDRILQNGDTVVLDMGAEYVGYATDITRSYAVNGKFTEDQKIVHNAVYEATMAVIRAMKPGVYWPDMHRLAERVIIEHLLRASILHNGTVEEMEAAYMGSVFMPHGLGHLVGLSVHDVGGYLPGTDRAKEPGVCYLRCGRKLEKGMLITVEPGLYFNDPTLNKALANPNQAKYINVEVLNRFRGTGGCRIEDDVLITENGAENLTILPTSVEEIEEVMTLAHQHKP